MPKTTYTSLSEITEDMEKIMLLVDDWVHKKKTPVPLTVIVADMEKMHNVGMKTVKYSLTILINKGYLRRAFTISNKVFFVQLRRV